MATNNNQAPGGVDMGLFNFGGLMEDFYNYKTEYWNEIRVRENRMKNRVLQRVLLVLKNFDPVVYLGISPAVLLA